MAEDLNEYPDVTENIDLVSLPTQSISSVTTVTADGDQLPIEVSYIYIYYMHVRIHAVSSVVSYSVRVSWLMLHKVVQY